MEVENRHSPKIITATVLIAILVLGTILRFANLGKLDLWIDEPYHAFVAESINKTGEAVLPSGMSYYHGYFYNHLVAYSIQIFGSNEFGVRFPSALLGVISILIVYYVGKEWLGKRVGLFAAFLMSISYLNLAWARVSRFYTLYQCVYMIAVFLVYHGIERGSRIVEKRLKRSAEETSGIGLVTLIVGLGLLYLAYLIHMTAVIFFGTLAVYTAILFAWVWVSRSAGEAIRSKYGLMLGVMVLGAMVAVLFFDLVETIRFAFTYVPDWANTDRFQNRYAYYSLFTSDMMFPLGALFLVGAVRTLTQLKKEAFYILLLFVVSVGIESVVFSYTPTNYIMYIYPFFLIVCGYGFFFLYDAALAFWIERLSSYPSERVKVLKQWGQGIVLLILIGWIPLTLWFKLGIRFPRFQHGEYNLVHTFLPWSWAAESVNRMKGEKDTVISTIPLTLMYYGLESHFNLNVGNNNLSRSRNVRDDEGRLLDPYSGVLTLMGLEDLIRVVEAHPIGWLVTNTYTMHLETCVKPEVKDYIMDHFELVDSNETVLIYRWGKREGAS